MQVIDDVLDLARESWTHNLTIVLDVYDEVSFALQYAWTFTALLRYCTDAQLAFTGGSCGCTGELRAAPTLQLGEQTLSWGDSVCLGEEDMRFYDEHGCVSRRSLLTRIDVHAKGRKTDVETS
jgi:hypothetical protein